MRKRGAVGIVMALVLSLALVAVATADVVLTVTPKQTVVNYPRPAHLVVTTPVAVAKTITVEARPVGGDWAAVKSIPASEAALATTFTVNPKLRVTSGIRVMQGAMVSEVVTVSVRAKLVAVRVIRHHGVYTVRGTILPNHVNGAVIGLHVWKKTGKGATAVLTPMPDVMGTVYRGNRQISWWQATFTPDGKGTYVIQAFHEDDGHVLSVSRRVTFKVRK